MNMYEGNKKPPATPPPQIKTTHKKQTTNEVKLLHKRKSLKIKVTK